MIENVSNKVLYVAGIWLAVAFGGAILMGKIFNRCKGKHE